MSPQSMPMGVGSPAESQVARLERELEEARATTEYVAAELREVQAMYERAKARYEAAESDLAEARQELKTQQELTKHYLTKHDEAVDLLREARRQNAQNAAEADRLAKLTIEMNEALAEARQERDAAKDAGWDWMVKANERFERIGELEAARDAARVSARSQKTKAQHARRAQQAMGARIQTLEAALRQVHPPGKGSHGNAIDDGIYQRCPACAALQPTTDHEEREEDE